MAREKDELKQENSGLKKDLADLEYDLDKEKEVAKKLGKDKAELQGLSQAMHKVSTDWVEKNASLSAQIQLVLARAMQW